MRVSDIAISVCFLSAFAGSIAQAQESTPVEPPALEQAVEEPLATLPPLTGSQLAPEDNRCGMCHTEPALWDDDHQKLFIQPELLERDVHRQKGVVCSDCHGGDPSSTNFAVAHVGLVPITELRNRCKICHNDQRLALVKSVHAKAGEKDSRGRGLPLDCSKCHGANAHAIFPAKDPQSPVFLNNQVRTCGTCHPGDQKTYELTVHGLGLNESGLTVTAVCADCHGAHGIYYAADRRSTLNAANVAATCSKCHQFIEERVKKSVHGNGDGLGSAAEKPAVGGRSKRNPTCTDCHQGHHMLNSEQADFRLQVANNCGNCHADMSSRYAAQHARTTDATRLFAGG